MPNFKLGELILKSTPYAYVLSNKDRGKRCDCCLKEKDGLRRCSQCLFLYFCDKSCQKKAWETHKAECKHIVNAKPNMPSASMRLMSLICFKIKQFGYDYPSTEVHGRKVSFGLLMSHSEDIKKNALSCKQMIALMSTLKDYVGAENIPPPAEYIEIFGKMVINTFSICDGEMENIGSGLYLEASVLDHSCQPNAEVVFDGIDLYVRAVEDMPHTDISKVNISYMEQMKTTSERQHLLNEQYFFTCQCERCTSSHYDDMMKKVLNPREDIENNFLKFKEGVNRIKQMEKDEVSSTSIYDACMNELATQEDILADTHLCKVKVLDMAFNSCLKKQQWADAIVLGNKLLGAYRLYYGTYSPLLGILLYKLGKVQSLRELHKSASENLLEKQILCVGLQMCEFLCFPHNILEDSCEISFICKKGLSVPKPGDFWWRVTISWTLESSKRSGRLDD